MRERRHGGWLLAAASAPMLAFLALPVVAVLLRVRVGEFLATITGPEAAQAVELSVWTTLITTAVAVVAGTPVAYLLARRQFPGRGALDTFFVLPMVLPPSVAGVALLLVFGRSGLLGGTLGALGLEIPFTRAAVVMAQLFVASPFYIKAAAAGFAAVDRELEQAAQIDGASPFRVFRKVTVPLASHAILGGAIMTWARALGEFGATIIFGGNFPGRTQTMPLAIYIGFEIDLRVALALAVVLLAASFAVMALVKVVLRQRTIVL